MWTQHVRDVQVEPRLQVIGPSMYGRVPKIAIGQSEIRQPTEVKDLSSLTTHLQFYGFLMIYISKCLFATYKIIFINLVINI